MARVPGRERGAEGSGEGPGRPRCTDAPGPPSSPRPPRATPEGRVQQDAEPGGPRPPAPPVEPAGQSMPLNQVLRHLAPCQGDPEAHDPGRSPHPALTGRKFIVWFRTWGAKGRSDISTRIASTSRPNGSGGRHSSA